MALWPRSDMMFTIPTRTRPVSEMMFGAPYTVGDLLPLELRTNLAVWWAAHEAYLDINGALRCTTNNQKCAFIYDGSGQARNATQPTISARPTFKPNRINGWPTLTFDGTDDFISCAGFDMKQPVTKYLVATFTADGGSQTNLVDGLSGSNVQAIRGQRSGVDSGKFSARTASFEILQTSPVNNTVFQAICCVYNGNGSTSGIQINRTKKVEGNLGGDVTTTGMCLGGAGGFGANGSQFTPMEFAEVLAYKEAHNLGMINNVVSYLNRKYFLKGF